MVINSHDVMQLTVTPTAVRILSELSELWTIDRTKKLRTVPGPTFIIHNELGIHSAVTVSAKHQVSDANQLTVRQRIPKRPAARQQSLADVAVNLPKSRPQSPHRDLKRILSEPLFNHLREKLQQNTKEKSYLRARVIGSHQTAEIVAARYGLLPDWPTARQDKKSRKRFFSRFRG
ncbi:hypothetical protein OS493_009871 [Desmophyllum pertusum]|uniref:Uncharacterized protein n=1 Tax=Desmophyllum pertusum TaxID=174260 RepID=A0A9W9YUB3_9CNID|nr:hypothetical protein OS493_009871 [Desmophyllum pertusum]